jgi:hypothetical protein
MGKQKQKNNGKILIKSRKFYLRQKQKTGEIMQEFIVPLAAVSTAAGLIVAGVNIAKGRKNYVGRDEHEKTIGRIHNRIDGVEGDVIIVKSEINEIKRNMVTKTDFEKRMDKTDSKLDAVRDGFIRIETLIEEFRRT